MAKVKYIVKVLEHRHMDAHVKLEAAGLIGNFSNAYSADRTMLWVSVEEGTPLGALTVLRGPYTPRQAAAERAKNPAFWGDDDLEANPIRRMR